MLGSKARIVHNVEINGPGTFNGYFSAIARPSCIQPLIISSNPIEFPAGGGLAAIDALTVTLDFPSSAQTHAGFPTSGSYKLGTADDTTLVHIEPLVDTMSITIPGLRIETQSASFFTATVLNNSSDIHYFQLWRLSAGVWASLGTVIAVTPGASTKYGTTQFAATSGSAIAMRMVTQTGAPFTPNNAITKVHIDYTFASARVTTALGAGSMGSFVRSQLVETGHVTNARVTAMSILCTSFANMTADDGEIVAADVRQSIAFNSSSIETLMTDIKSLPEGNRWYSGAAKHGAYTYYVPDDLTSYEPKEYTDRNIHDNCCVIAGKINPVGGLVRLQITWIVEFYTKAQLFEREMGPSWTREYQLALKYLQTTAMATANDDHENMAATIHRNVHSAWRWIMDHADDIERGVAITGSILAAVG
jgi:hypothetical protein